MVRAEGNTNRPGVRVRPRAAAKEAMPSAICSGRLRPWETGVTCSHTRHIRPVKEARSMAPSG